LRMFYGLRRQTQLLYRQLNLVARWVNQPRGLECILHAHHV